MDGLGFTAIGIIWTPNCIHAAKKDMLKKKKLHLLISFVRLLVCSFLTFTILYHMAFFCTCTCIHGIRLITFIFFFLFAKNYVIITYHSVQLLIYASPVYVCMLCLFIQINNFPIIIYIQCATETAFGIATCIHTVEPLLLQTPLEPLYLLVS